MKSRPHGYGMAELYRGDPAFALEVINGILDGGDPAKLLIVLSQMVQASGGVQAVNEQVHLNPTHFIARCRRRGGQHSVACRPLSRRWGYG